MLQRAGHHRQPFGDADRTVGLLEDGQHHFMVMQHTSEHTPREDD
jgi:hypothetical protein